MHSRRALILTLALKTAITAVDLWFTSCEFSSFVAHSVKSHQRLFGTALNPITSDHVPHNIGSQSTPPITFKSYGDDGDEKYSWCNNIAAIVRP